MAIKTLHLTNAFHSRSGGIATFYWAMLQAANQQRREMRLIVPGEEDGVEQVGAYGRIYYVRAHKAPLNGSYRCIYPNQYLHAHHTLRKILLDERPDLIEVCDKYNLHYLGGMIREKLLPELDFRPVMLGLSCERMDENVAAYVGNTLLHRWFCRWYMHWFYFPLFDHHAAVSEHAAVELVAASQDHRVQRGIWVRPMGVDVAQFSPARRSPAVRRHLLEKANAGDGAILLLYAGRLAPEKNLPLLIEMMHLLASDPEHDYRLIVVGDGMERERLERKSGQLAPGRVCFLDHITDRERLAGIYASCDLFVHPNPREPFGIAPLEALASGLPLVGANSGGLTSFARPGNAWLAEAEPAAFAHAVRQAMGDEGARAAKVRAGLATAAGHSWESAALGYFALYEAIHAEFWGFEGAASCPPYARSTRATRFGDGVISTSNLLAQTLFHTVVRCSSQRPGPVHKSSSSGYVRMVPSVTVKDEKQRPFCIQERQT